jgi:hypothetical protein
MKRKDMHLWRANKRDHTVATIARIVLGAVGVLAGLLIVRSIPDLIRYAKMERM